MATANLHETLLAYAMRKNALQLEMANLNDQVNLAIYAQADNQSLLSARKHEVRDYFKGLYEEDESLHEKYIDYTKIPEFEEEIDKITAEFQQKLDELANWETQLKAQITTDNTELEEIEAYMESFESMLKNNISEDYKYGFN